MKEEPNIEKQDTEIPDSVKETHDTDIKNISEKSIEELLLELEELTNTSQNPYSISKNVEEIKNLFYKKLKSEDYPTEDSLNEDKKDTLHPAELKFKKTYTKFKKIKSNYRREREKIEEDNLIKKQNIIKDIDNLVKEEESVKTTFEKFKILQKKWKETGNVPIHKSNDLWQNYHHHVELFYDYLKINRELRDLDFKKNLEQKIRLCEKAESLISEKSVNTSFDRLQELHQSWKETGPVVREERENIWKRFQEASRKINKKRNDYFLQIKERNQSNLDKKSAICRQIKELSSSSNSHQEWRNKTEQLVMLSEKWKKAAPINKKDLKKSWSEFREVCSHFYSLKNSFYKSQKENNNNNLMIKINICEKAESLSNSTDWKNASKELINLQNDWKNSAYVPDSLSSPIWKRFRKACNTFFNSRKEYYSKQDKEREKNLKIKENLIKEVKNFTPSDSPKSDIEKLKEFSVKWNKAGFLPDKYKNISNNFNRLISSHYNNLKVSKKEKEEIQFQAKVESLKVNSNLLNMEKEQLRSEIEKLKKTIIQYENNISFFGNSKGTEKLKDDVLKKIEKSKSEIDQLKSKLSVLNKI